MRSPASPRLPEGATCSIRRARVPTCFLVDAMPSGANDDEVCTLVDITVEAGRFGRVTHVGDSDGPEPVFDLVERQVWPWHVDMHTLDKSNTEARTPNPNGDFATARGATAATVGL